jgi:hypothetical protein
VEQCGYADALYRKILGGQPASDSGKNGLGKRLPGRPRSDYFLQSGKDSRYYLARFPPHGDQRHHALAKKIADYSSVSMAAKYDRLWRDKIPGALAS